MKKHDPNLTGADVFDIGWVEQKHQLLGSEIPLTEVLRFPLHFFGGENHTHIGSMPLVDLPTFAYICHKDQVDIGKYTPLKSNIAYIATQNDAMFEFGDTSSKPSFLVSIIILVFWGVPASIDSMR